MNNLMSYKGYYAKINYSNEDECFFGEVIGLSKTAITFEGESVKKLQKEFEKAIKDYLENCKQNNEIPEKTYKGSFNVRVNPNIHKKASIYSIMQGISLNQCVDNALIE